MITLHYGLSFGWCWNQMNSGSSKSWSWRWGDSCDRTSGSSWEVIKTMMATMIMVVATMITITADTDDGDDDDVNEENDDYDNFDRNGWWFISFMQVPEGELYQLQLGQKLWRGDLKSIRNLHIFQYFHFKNHPALEIRNWHIFQYFQYFRFWAKFAPHCSTTRPSESVKSWWENIDTLNKFEFYLGNVQVM